MKSGLWRFWGLGLGLWVLLQAFGAEVSPSQSSLTEKSARAESLLKLGDEEAEQDHSAPALEAFEKVLQTLDGVPGASAMETRSLALRGAARQLTTLERYPEARAMLTNALNSWELGPAPSGIRARILGAFAWVEEEAADWSTAFEWYRRSGAEFVGAGGGDSPEHLDLINDEARLLYLSGDVHSAAERMGHVVAVGEKTGRTNDLEIAISRRLLGRFLRETGRLVEAESQLLKVQDAMLRKYGERADPVAAAQVALGQLHQAKGDFWGAEASYRRALEIRLSLTNTPAERLAEVLNNLGMLARFQGQVIQAESYFNRALELLTNSQPMVRLEQAITLANRGENRIRFDRFAEAEADLMTSFQIRSELLPPGNPDLGNSHKKFGRYFSQRGDLGRALLSTSNAVEIFRASYGESHPETASMEFELAELLVRMGRTNEALQRVRRALPARHLELESVLAGSSERQRLLYRSRRDNLSLACVVGDPVLVGEILARERGVVLDSLLQESRRTGESEAREISEIRQTLRSVADARLSLDLNAPTQATALVAWRQRREALRIQQEELEGRLARETRVSQSDRPAATVGHSDAQKALAPNQALVEYVQFRQPVGTTGKESHLGALVTVRDGPSRWVPLGPALRATELIEALRRSVEPSLGGPEVDAAFCRVLPKGSRGALATPLPAPSRIDHPPRLVSRRPPPAAALCGSARKPGTIPRRDPCVEDRCLLSRLARFPSAFGFTAQDRNRGRPGLRDDPRNPHRRARSAVR
jgi:tetratricopeptide (TPR) repeat protein